MQSEGIRSHQFDKEIIIHVQIYKTLSLMMTVNQDQRETQEKKERQTYATHFNTLPNVREALSNFPLAPQVSLQFLNYYYYCC